MVTSTVARSEQAAAAPAGSTRSALFERVAGVCAVLAALGGFLYAVAFILLHNAGLSALCLLLVGLLSTAALVAVYDRVREVDGACALWAILLSMAGAFGAAIHGGYDLANSIHPPAAQPALPSAIDPRGLLTFGVAGLGLAALAWLIGRGKRFPTHFHLLGYLTALLLIILYIGRLVILDARNPLIVGPAVLNGFLVNPAWYLWLGLLLWRGRAA